jgi:ABC-type nitrate/sulfonate/bicarbonate transport system permease component
VTPGALSQHGSRLAGYLASITVVLALWQYGANRAIIPLLFPSPASTLAVGLQLFQNGQLGADFRASVLRILTGFALGSALGVTAGVFMGAFRPVRLLFEPYVQFLRFLPALAWIPPVMLWLGTGEPSKIALLTYTTVFIVALNTMVGVTRVPRNQIRAAQSFGATRWVIFRMVTIPATVGHMLTGMRLAMGNCFMTVVAAELVASDSGLGYLIFSSRQWMQTELAFVGISILGVLGLVSDRVFHLTTTRLLWRYAQGQAGRVPA